MNAPVTTEPQTAGFNLLEQASLACVFPFEAKLNGGGAFYSRGLTKRELFAAMVLQGFAACPDIDGEPQRFDTKDAANAAADVLMKSHAARSVEWADALLAALERGTP